MRWLILVFAACSAGTPGPGIDVDRAMAHIGELCALGPRPGDSEPARRAAAYIEAQLEVMQLRAERVPVGGVDLPEIRVLGTTWRAAHHVETTDPDLLLRFGPPGPALLVMAHYDTVPPSPGAVDNAAAVAVLLELARVLHDHPPQHPVMLAFTANEEIGLVGAEALAAARGSDVDFAIALDLIGGSGPLVINGASDLVGRSELQWIGSAGIPITAPPAHRVISRWWPQAERSDHGPFTRRGIRAVHFYNRGQDGDRIDLAYHSARDIPSRVDRHSIDDIGRLLRALAESSPPPHDGDGYWIPATQLVVPRWILLACELALAAATLLLLATWRRRDARSRGAGLLAGIACYALATAAAIATERTAAGDHPAPWLHAPLRSALAEAAIIAGVLGLVTRLVARRWPWAGDRRYLALASLMLLAFGVALFAVGAPELAWVWLVPAATVALAPRVPRVIAPLALAPSLLPAILVLAPGQLREAAWNGFLPLPLPLAAWIAVLGAPAAACLAWWLRRAAPGPLGSLVLALGCGLAVLTGAVVTSLPHPTCTASEFHQFHLACEQVLTWP